MISVTELLAHAIENELTVYFNYAKSNPTYLRSGIPLRLLNNGRTLAMRIETYVPYRRYIDQLPVAVEYKNFTVDHIRNLCVEYSNDNLEFSPPLGMRISPIEDIVIDIDTSLESIEPIEVVIFE